MLDPVVHDRHDVTMAIRTLLERYDCRPDAAQAVKVEIYDTAVCISAEGYGDKGTAAGHGTPILLERGASGLVLHVWADINQEDPTHTIDLSGALESRRKAEE